MSTPLTVRPKGVIKVVNSRDSGARGICQNPLYMFASNLLKIVAPASLPNMSSILGMAPYGFAAFVPAAADLAAVAPTDLHDLCTCS